MSDAFIDESLPPILLGAALVTGVAAAVSFLLSALSRRAAPSKSVPTRVARQDRHGLHTMAPPTPATPAEDEAGDTFEDVAATAPPVADDLVNPWITCERCGHGYRRGAAACPECTRRAAEADQLRPGAARFAFRTRIAGVISLVLAVACFTGYAWTTDQAQRRASKRMIDNERLSDRLRNLEPPNPHPLRSPSSDWPRSGD